MTQSLSQRFLDSKRIVSGLIASYTALMLAVGFVLQYAVGLVPCPLCIIQRFFFGLVGLVGLIGAIHGRFLNIYAGAMFTFATLGFLVAARNVYIEWAPKPELGHACIPWLESFTQWIAALFQATGDCGQRDWTMLSLSIPEWSLLSFALLIAVTIAMLWGKEKSVPHQQHSS